MRDLYLRFTDKAEMEKAFTTFGFQKDENEELFHPGICLDIVGVITTIVENENGKQRLSENESDPVTYESEPGYHANIRVLNDDLNLSVLQAFAITPKTPARVWA